MKIIIAGCGKLGSSLANSLNSMGNKVTVISREAKDLRRLSKDFKGEKITGAEIDKDTLMRAKIDKVDAVIACTENDEINAVVARLSRVFFKVPKVIARLFDQNKVTIYNTMGIQVIASTNWAIERTKEILFSSSLEPVLDVGNEGLKVMRIEVPSLLVGKNVGDVNKPGEIQVVAISRQNRSILPLSGMDFMKGDIIYIAVTPESVGILKNILGLVVSTDL